MAEVVKAQAQQFVFVLTPVVVGSRSGHGSVYSSVVIGISSQKDKTNDYYN